MGLCGLFTGTGCALLPAVGLGGSALRGGFSPLQLWGIWIQPRWWSFTMCGWTDTALMVSTWFLLPKHPEQCPGVGAYTELKYLLFYADKWVLVDPIAAWDICAPMTSAAAILHPAHININQWGGNFQLATAGYELQWWRNRICFISCCRGSNLRQKGRAERWRWAMP